MDPKNKKRRADRTFYDSDSDYETRTMTMNWPRFLLVESGDDSLPVTKLSPFAIDKGFQALISGRLRSIKRLRNGTFLVECDTKKQSDLLLKSQKLVDRPMIVSIHPTLNSSRGWARHSCDRRLHSCHCLCCVLVFSVVLDFSDFARMTVRNL